MDQNCWGNDTNCWGSEAICVISPTILLHFPNKSASFPQQFASFPQQYASFPQQYESFPRTIFSFPQQNFVSVCQKKIWFIFGHTTPFLIHLFTISLLYGLFLDIKNLISSTCLQFLCYISATDVTTVTQNYYNGYFSTPYEGPILLFHSAL